MTPTARQVREYLRRAPLEELHEFRRIVAWRAVRASEEKEADRAAANLKSLKPGMSVGWAPQPGRPVGKAIGTVVKMNRKTARVMPYRGTQLVPKPFLAPLKDIVPLPLLHPQQRKGSE